MLINYDELVEIGKTGELDIVNKFLEAMETVVLDTYEQDKANAIKYGFTPPQPNHMMSKSGFFQRINNSVNNNGLDNTIENYGLGNFPAIKELFLNEDKIIEYLELNENNSLNDI